MKDPVDLALRRALGEALRALRKQHKPPLSQEELALRSEISRSYLSELERGEHDVGLWTLWRLKSALKVTAGHLVREIEAHLKLSDDAKPSNYFK